MCLSILVKNILMLGSSGSSTYRLSRSRVRLLDFSTRVLRIWGRSILTSIILGWRYLVLHLRLGKSGTHSRLAGRVILHTRRLHLAGAASPLLPRESATGLSVFAGDVDHDC